MNEAVTEPGVEVSSEGYVGSSARTLEGRAPIVGAAQFTSDFKFEGQLYAAFLRSPYAAAKIKLIDTSPALKVPGVVFAMDGKGAEAHLNPITHYIDPAVFGGEAATVRCLALDEIWCYGQPIAVVVADDIKAAQYAVEKIRLDLEVLEPVVSIEDAIDDNARVVADGLSSNIMIRAPFVNGDPEGAFEEAEHVVSASVNIHRFSTQPIETRCYTAVWEEHTESIALYATAQNPHPLRHVLSDVLGMPESKLRVVAPSIGGAFGMKMHGHPEEALICLLAKLLRKPVKWRESREECLLVGAREQMHRMKLAFNAKYELIGLQDNFYANVGAPTACPGWGMAFLTGVTMPGPYAVKNIDVQMAAVHTNKPSWNAARGYGKEATAIALELALDEAARHLQVDPIELRLKNFIQKDAFPYPSPTGLIYDSGDYSGALKKALEAIDYEEWKTRQSQALHEGKYIGIGTAFELTPEGGALPGTMVAGYDSSSVRMSPDGAVRVLTGVTTPGTGNPTGIAQIVADELGVSLSTIEVVQGDTTTCPYGFGNYSGRSTIVGGGSAALAARDVRQMLLKVAAALAECDVDDLELKEGLFFRNGHEAPLLTVKEVSYAAYTRAYDVAACITPPLEATRTFLPPNIRHTPDEEGRINPYPSYSNAAYVAVCEVDVETGKTTLLKFAAAHDCGKAINPILVEGQACGAIAFGVGGALSENIQIDAAGRQLTRSFESYVMPRCEDIPEIEVRHHDSPNPYTYMGLKGAGEAGVGGSAAAVANAVNNALSPLNVSLHELPFSAPAVWRQIQLANTDKASQEGE